ncbi:hypothetical protein Tco_1203744, partial [Tanacetum coccineum]
RTIDQSAGGKLHDRNIEESWALFKDLALYDNESWNDPRDFAKSVKAISLPQDALSTSECHLIELKNQVQRLMEAHLAPKQPVQVNKISSSCEICSGPHDTQYCMENPEQAFVDYVSSRTDEARSYSGHFQPDKTIRDLPINHHEKSSKLSSINAITIYPKQTKKPHRNKSEGEKQEERSNPENIDTTPPSPPDPSISFITKKVRKLNSFLESSGLVPKSP